MPLVSSLFLRYITLVTKLQALVPWYIGCGYYYYYYCYYLFLNLLVTKVGETIKLILQNKR